MRIKTFNQISTPCCRTPGQLDTLPMVNLHYTLWGEIPFVLLSYLNTLDSIICICAGLDQSSYGSAVTAFPARALADAADGAAPAPCVAETDRSKDCICHMEVTGHTHTHTRICILLEQAPSFISPAADSAEMHEIPILPSQV